MLRRKTFRLTNRSFWAKKTVIIGGMEYDLMGTID